MEFVAAKCPNCGGELRLPDDKKQVKCMYCGFDVLVREAINAAGANIENWLKIASSAKETGNYQEAYDYFTKVLEYEPDNYIALLGKGISAAQLSTKFNFRSDELIQGLRTAIEKVPEDKKQELITKSCEEIYSACHKFRTVTTAEPYYSSLNEPYNVVMKRANESEQMKKELMKVVKCLEVAHEYCPKNADVLEELEIGYGYALITPQVRLENHQKGFLKQNPEEIPELNKTIRSLELKKEEYFSKLQTADPERFNAIVERRKQNQDEMRKLSEKYSPKAPAKVATGGGCLVTMIFIFLSLLAIFLAL